MKKINEQDMDDILVGSAILGTGGGGSLKRARKTVKKDFDEGREFKLINLDELDKEDLVGSPYFCGSLSPEGEEKEKGVGWTSSAVKVLEDHFEEKFRGLVATEIGAGNLGVAFSTAARYGVPLIDADPAGRSVPELSHTTFHVYDVDIDPIGVSDGRNNILVKEVEDDFIAEKIVRSLAVAASGTVGVCDHPGPAKKMRGTLIEGTVTKSKEIGRKRRKAIENGKDPVEAITEDDGYVIFTGTVNGYTWKEKDGFTVGEVHVKDDDGNELKIWFKNEHLVSWLNGDPYVVAPDLITLVTKDKAEPLLNPNIKEGQEVAVLSYKADEKWRTEDGLEVLSPKYFGYDFEYVPVEKVI